jgi:hypothetical protein
VDRAYWTKKLREAELEAARTRTEVNAAAKKLQRAKAELKALKGVLEKPVKRPTPWPGAGGALPERLALFANPKPVSSRCSR